MGLFRREKTGHRDVRPQVRVDPPAVDKTLETLAVTAMATDHPSATDEQLRIMVSLEANLRSERGGKGFEPKQLAAISTLCERLVAANPELERFVESLREIARAEHAVNPQVMAWWWLANEL